MAKMRLAVSLELTALEELLGVPGQDGQVDVLLKLGDQRASGTPATFEVVGQLRDFLYICLLARGDSSPGSRDSEVLATGMVSPSDLQSAPGTPQSSWVVLRGGPGTEKRVLLKWMYASTAWSMDPLQAAADPAGAAILAGERNAPSMPPEYLPPSRDETSETNSDEAVPASPLLATEAWKQLRARNDEAGAAAPPRAEEAWKPLWELRSGEEPLEPFGGGETRRTAKTPTLQLDKEAAMMSPSRFTESTRASLGFSPSSVATTGFFAAPLESRFQEDPVTPFSVSAESVGTAVPRPHGRGGSPTGRRAGSSIAARVRQLELENRLLRAELARGGKVPAARREGSSPSRRERSPTGRARKGAVRSSRPQLAEADAVWERIYAASASLNGQPQYPAVGGQRTTWERIYNAEASCHPQPVQPALSPKGRRGVTRQMETDRNLYQSESSLHPQPVQPPRRTGRKPR